MSLPDEAPRAAHDECYECPVGGVFARMQSTQPEALEHLLNAAHELVQVARAALEVAEQAIAKQREASGGAQPRVQRIDIS